MTFKQIWEQLVRKRPELANDDTRTEFTAGNLKQLLEQVYDQAQKAEREANKPSKSIFEDFFNR